MPQNLPLPPSELDLKPDVVFNASNPLLMRQLSTCVGSGSLDDKMGRWYRFVRDAIRYDPYSIDWSEKANSASRTLENQRGHCVHKSVLFIAGLRALGVPSRLGLARVANHLGTESLERKLGSHILSPHGYAAHWDGSKWVKSTPVFNAELCHRLGTEPLEWNQHEDRLLQASDAAGSRFMEYLEDFGLHSSLPVALIHEKLKAEYPKCFDESGQWRLIGE